MRGERGQPASERPAESAAAAAAAAARSVRRSCLRAEPAGCAPTSSPGGRQCPRGRRRPERRGARPVLDPRVATAGQRRWQRPLESAGSREERSCLRFLQRPQSPAPRLRSRRPPRGRGRKAESSAAGISRGSVSVAGQNLMNEARPTAGLIYTRKGAGPCSRHHFGVAETRLPGRLRAPNSGGGLLRSRRLLQPRRVSRRPRQRGLFQAFSGARAGDPSLRPAGVPVTQLTIFGLVLCLFGILSNTSEGIPFC